MTGETGININAPTIAIFNEAMNPGSLNNGTFMIDGGAIGGEVVYDQATRTARFEPAVALELNSTYTAMLTTGVCDAACNHMATNKTWSFTTGAVATPVAYSSPTLAPAATTPVSTPAGAEWLLLTAFAIGIAGYASRGKRQA